jgi:phosphate-selective porin OprO/OprP
LKVKDKILRSKAKGLLAYAILGNASLLAPPAYTSTEMLSSREQITINQDELESLSNSAKADEENKISEQNNFNKKMAGTNRKSIKVKTGYEGLTVESANGDFKFKVRGRIQADAVLVDEDKIDLENSTELRRARLNLEGTLWKIWDYRFEADFGGNDPRMTNAYIKFKGLKPVNFTLGYQKVPVSLQSITGNNWTVFQERATINSFINNDEIGRRRLGLSMDTHGNHWTNWTAKAGFYGTGIDNAGKSSDNWGTAGRVTIAPIAKATRVVHMGGSAYYRNFKHAPELALSTHPEAHLAPKLIGTAMIPEVKEILLLGGEFSAVWGPFHAQSEYLRAEVGRKNGLPEPSFDGWYAQAGYFLTGESRNYETDKGRYGRITPHRIMGQGGWGAWEIAARYSTIDLENDGILGGKERNITFGINWWATQNILFRANYVRAMIDPNSSRPQLRGENKDTNIFMTRVQIAF